MTTPGYHRPRHWDQVHHSAVPGSPSLAARALSTSVYDIVAGEVPADGTVVDIACGTGGLLRGLPAGPRAVGMDFSGEAVGLAAGSPGPGRGGGADWVRADAHQLPLRGASVDAVLCLAGVWVFADPARVLTEAFRVLRPGGVAVVHLWGSPADCRLITLGAVSVGQVVQGSRLTAGVTGPFELTPDRVDVWLRDAGFAPADWRRSDLRLPMARPDDYWPEFAALAPTSYDHYRRAATGDRVQIRALLAGLLTASRRRAGDDSLSLSWLLGVARRAAG
ncbi:class I SAM-dependent methyltransferase [Streptomyces sp. NPDC058653]|uniref:class I SAM-dependent methyltransferase n=1 Tax=Streptomyces sp. NPDC058653 TaxID=3346576 RepID=UPI003664E799